MEAQNARAQGSALCLLKAFHSLAVPRTQSKSEEAGPSQLPLSCRATVMLFGSMPGCGAALLPGTGCHGRWSAASQERLVWPVSHEARVQSAMRGMCSPESRDAAPSGLLPSCRAPRMPRQSGPGCDGPLASSVTALMPPAGHKRVPCAILILLLCSQISQQSSLCEFAGAAWLYLWLSQPSADERHPPAEDCTAACSCRQFLANGERVKWSETRG